MHLPLLIVDLAYILGIAACVTLLFKRLKQPAVLGYIIAGLIVGPYLPGPIVGDTKGIQVWAELGVIFIMFSLGLEFSFRKLVKIGFPAVISGVIQISTMLILGYYSGLLLGWSSKASLFLAGMVSISSTMIIVKVFEELKLRGRKFTDMVFGILIIEDLAAILILVSLSTFGHQTEWDGIALLQSAGKLILVVGMWFLFGMFLVPKFMRSVGQHESNELLIMASTALCLGLVCIAAKFEYSVALGAFMMGSILAETKDIKRIESLVEPLRDLFGAVFFVSIGMLLDPKIIGAEWKSVALVTLIVVGGRIFAGALGSAVSGQSIEDCTRISLSKAQIGEFSFIIATLGLSSGALNAEVFPVIVATSVLTIFTTPYFIKYSDLISAKMLTTIPPRGQQAYERYCTWLERKMTSSSGGPSAYRDLARWFSCSIILITIFEGIATFLLKALQERFTTFGSLIAWIIAILASMPFIWAIVFPTKPPTSHQQHKFSRRLSLVGATLTVLLIGVLSREFFSFLDALVLTILLVFGLLIVSRKHLEVRYRWIEGQFLSGFSSPSDEKPHGKERVTKKILGPWNAHLQEVAVPSGSEFGGLTLADLQIREKYGVNIICIERNDQLFATPLPTQRILPQDKLLVFGDDENVTNFFNAAERKAMSPSEMDSTAQFSNYRTSLLTLEEGHRLINKTIRQSRLREDCSCLVVGIEKEKVRIKNPHSDLLMEVGDTLWLVGPESALVKI